MKKFGLFMAVALVVMFIQLPILPHSAAAQSEDEGAESSQVQLDSDSVESGQAAFDSGQYEEQEASETLQVENDPGVEGEYDASGGMVEEGGGVDLEIEGSEAIQNDEQEPYEIVQDENSLMLESEGVVEEGEGDLGQYEQQEPYENSPDETAPVGGDVYEEVEDTESSDQGQYEQGSDEVYLEENATELQNEGRAE